MADAFRPLKPYISGDDPRAWGKFLPVAQQFIKNYTKDHYEQNVQDNTSVEGHRSDEIAWGRGRMLYRGDHMNPPDYEETAVTYPWRIEVEVSGGTDFHEMLAKFTKAHRNLFLDPRSLLRTTQRWTDRQWKPLYRYVSYLALNLVDVDEILEAADPLAMDYVRYNQSSDDNVELEHYELGNPKLWDYEMQPDHGGIYWVFKVFIHVTDAVVEEVDPTDDYVPGRDDY